MAPAASSRPRRVAKRAAQRTIGVLRRLRGRRTEEPVPAGRRWAAGLPDDAPQGRTTGLETTHVGDIFDQGVAAARARMIAPGVDPDYDLAAEHFDVAGFLLQAPGFLETQVDPLRHYLANGAGARARPEVSFSMRDYLARYPEHAEAEPSPYLHWLRTGRAAGEIADPAPGLEEMAEVLGVAATTLADQLASSRADLQHRLRHGKLGEMMARAERIEPLVGEAWAETMRPRMLPMATPRVSSQISVIHRSQALAGFARATVLLVVTEPRWGAGRRMEGHLAHALARTIDPSEIVVLYTDRSGRTPEGRFPAGVREVDFAAQLPDLTSEDRDETDPAGLALVALIRSFGATAVVNVNSMRLYKAMTRYGAALTATERVFTVLFCNEQLERGNWVGLSLRYFYRLYDDLAGVVTDSHYLRDWLHERHQFDGDLADRVHVLSAPVDPAIPLAPRPGSVEGRRPRVFWAGRWDRQKRPDLVFAIARAMPETDFVMWGEPVLGRSMRTEVLPNVSVRPPFPHLSEVDLGEADAWLYTSAWDGVPSILLEVAMTGVPIVGSLVGGTGEVLTDDDSWPVSSYDDPQAYVDALREVLADPATAGARAARLRDRLTRTRTDEAFAEQVRTLLLPEEHHGR